mmetsp:Transcript_21164/g.48585  ORF Transcript_21164/g.48585 Transcript_21164/m.48585 type:complete len:141 (-) Transcript_21164:100-522(-)
MSLGKTVLGAKDDVEAIAAPKQTMMAEPMHTMGMINSDSSHASAPKEGDQLYSKCLCYNCGIGEVLGEVICGAHDMFFCYEAQSDCGLGGKGGCLKGLSSCELFMPEARCGMFEKFFCIKCGCVSPLDKPFLVIAGSTIV